MTIRSHPFLAALLLLGAGGCGPSSPERNLLVNGGLHGGNQPKGWEAGPGTLTERAHGFLAWDPGLVIRRAPGMPGEATAVLSQTVNAVPLRGRRIRMGAEGRLEPGAPVGAGRFFLRVDRLDGREGFFDNLQGREIRTEDWRRVALIGDVAADATGIALGAFLEGKGGFRVRRFLLEDLGPTPPEALAPPRPLAGRGLENLAALARALAYIRYFHPSDQAARADWNRVAVQAVRTVEGADAPAALAGALDAALGPLAPTARFLLPGAAAPGSCAPPEAVQAVRWHHLGLGVEPQGVYRSERRRLPLASLPPDWTARLRPLSLELGRGVTLSLPTVVYADALGRTLPGTVAAPAPSLEPTAFQGSAEDRAARLAAVCAAWGGPQHFHPSLGGRGGPWQAALAEALGQAAVDADGPALARTLRRLNARLGDGHGRIHAPWPPDQVPALSLVFLQGRPYVRATGERGDLEGAAGGQPSGDAPPLPGSELLQVDGQPVAGVIATLRREISAPGGTWLGARLAQELLGGMPGSSVRIRFRQPDGSVREATLPRNRSPREVRCYGLPAAMAELRPGVWYLDPERLGEAQFAGWVKAHGGCKGVILDFRGYPALPASFLGHFLDREVPGIPVAVPVVEGPDGRDWRWDFSSRAWLTPAQPQVTARVVGLVDGGSASYSESCLATLQAHRLARLVGERSAGVNGQLVSLALPCGFTETFTGTRVSTYDGRPFEDAGVRPDLAAPATLRGLRLGRLEPLERALALLPP